jgi:hypothetical protein
VRECVCTFMCVCARSFVCVCVCVCVCLCVCVSIEQLKLCTCRVASDTSFVCSYLRRPLTSGDKSRNHAPCFARWLAVVESAGSISAWFTCFHILDDCVEWTKSQDVATSSVSIGSCVLDGICVLACMCACSCLDIFGVSMLNVWGARAGGREAPPKEHARQPNACSLLPLLLMTTMTTMTTMTMMATGMYGMHVAC